MPRRPIISATSPGWSANSPRSAFASSTPRWRPPAPRPPRRWRRRWRGPGPTSPTPQAHPGMYGLMFRTERLDMSRPSLCEAANASFAGLAGAIGASRQEQISEQALSLGQAAEHRPRLVAGARFYDAAARWSSERHLAPAAERHRRRDAAGCHAQARDRTDAGGVISAVAPARRRGRCRRSPSPRLFPHPKPRANWSAVLRASSLASGLAFTST